MALARFLVVFLLGLGAAFGAYASGMMHYFAHSGMQSWFAYDRPVVLQVSADPPATVDPRCPTRYSVDNHSSRRVLVFFTSPGDQVDARTASDFGRSMLEAPGYYGSEATDVPPNGPVTEPEAAGVRAQATIPIEVAPGEEKDIEPLDGGENSAIGRHGPRIPAAFAAVRCGSDRLVTLQLNDCTTDESGVCSTAGTFSPGGE